MSTRRPSPGGNAATHSPRCPRPSPSLPKAIALAAAYQLDELELLRKINLAQAEEVIEIRRDRDELLAWAEKQVSRLEEAIGRVEALLADPRRS